MVGKSLVTLVLTAVFLTGDTEAGGVEALPNLLDLAVKLNLTTLVKAIKDNGIDHTLNHEGKFTIFAPSNDAFAHEKQYPGEASVAEKIKFHIARGLYKSKDIVDEATVKTMLNNRTIRFNIYPNGKVTANGRTIASTDHEAHNGVIHILSDVMSSVYHLAGSVISELDECCPQHSDLIELVKVAGLYDFLDTTGPFTYIAPLNGAFDKLHPDFIIHIKKNVTALRSLLLGHVVPLTWYSPGFVDGQFIKTVIGNKIDVKVAKNGTVMLGKATVTLGDITAGNGVIHSVDEVLFPKQLQSFHNQIVEDFLLGQQQTKNPDSLVELCRDLGFTSFADALDRTKVGQMLEKGGPYTVFAPSNEAFDHPESYSIASDEVDRVKFHIAKGVVKPKKIRNGQRMATMLEKRFIRFGKFQSRDSRPVILANGREVSFLGRQTANGVVHALPNAAMDYVYKRNGTLLQELSQQPHFSKFVKYLLENDLDSFLADTKASFTVLAPNDSAFEAMMNVDMSEEEGTELFFNHIVWDILYTRNFEEMSSITTIGKKVLPVSKDETGAWIIENRRLLQKDCSTVNGVYHEVDGFL